MAIIHGFLLMPNTFYAKLEVMFLYSTGRQIDKTGFQDVKSSANIKFFSMIRNNSFGDKFTFSNACAIHIKLGTNELLNKNCAEEYGILAELIRS